MGGQTPATAVRVLDPNHYRLLVNIEGKFLELKFFEVISLPDEL